MRYKPKSVDELAWSDIRDQAKLDIKKVVKRLENEVLIELSQKFDKAINAGQLDNIWLEFDEVVGLVKKHAKNLEV